MTTKSRGAISEVLGLLKPYRVVVALSILLGMLGGVSVTALLATINKALNGSGVPSATVLLTFAGLCAFALLNSILSDIGTNHVGQHIIAGLRKSLGEKSCWRPSSRSNGFAVIA